MRHPLLPAFALAAALAAGGCATSIPPVELTRFHRIEVPASMPAGSYTIVARDARPGAPDSLADRSYQAAVAQQLDRLGYRSSTTVAAGQPDYIVTVGLDRAERAADNRGGGVNVGVGGGTGGYRSGVGVGVGLDLTSLFADRRDVIATRLTVMITRRGEELALWEGRAETIARNGTPAAQPGLAADKLATALFADFPGRSGETISVP
jgi:Domain of unknown function (DUF4136)